MINYDNKVFITLSNSANKDVNNETFFHYHQSGKIINAEYFGGDIKTGFLTGIVHKDSSVDLKFHHINQKNELVTGISHITPQLMIDGKVMLTEKWKWTCKNYSFGESVLQEVTEEQKIGYLKIANGY